MLKPRYLYHGTVADQVPQILREGLRSPSYWGTKRMAEHWAERRGAYADGIVLIRRKLSEFDAEHLFWDELMEEEPVWFEYQVEEDQRAACEQAQGYWEESLEILESVIYDLPVKVKAIEVLQLKQQDQAIDNLAV